MSSGRTSEWRSQALGAYQRHTRRVEALLPSTYLADTNARRVKRVSFALFKGAASKDMVSRTWRKVKGGWDAWCNHSLAQENTMHLLLEWHGGQDTAG